MAGFILRLVLCNALCLGLSLPVLWGIAEMFAAFPGLHWLATPLLALWILVAVPVIWLRSYRWLEDGERR